MPDRPTLPALLTNQNTGFRIFALVKCQPFIRFELRHPGKKQKEEDEIEKNNEQERKEEKWIDQYSPLSHCGHPAKKETPIKRTIAKSPAKTNYRLTEINSRYYGLSPIWTLIITRGTYSVHYRGS